MARQGIFTGFSPNDGTGDSLASGAVKINANFQEIYNTFGDGNNLTPVNYVNLAGVSTYSTTSGVSTYSVLSGVSTYSISSGISTVSQGLTGTPNLNVGVVTATQFFGDGSNLTGIVASGSGVVIQEEGTNVGTAQTINFLGVGVTATVLNGVATVEVTSTGNVVGSESYWTQTTSGIHTLSNVGIGTTNPQTTLTVGGIISFAKDSSSVLPTNTRIGDTTTGQNLNSTVNGNIFVGPGAGKSTVNGSHNVFIGREAGFKNVFGGSNNIIGWQAGYNSTSSNNQFIGRLSGYFNTTGDQNTFLGHASGYSNITGRWNTYTGAFTGISTATNNKVILGSGFSFDHLFDSPDTTKNIQFAVGVRTDVNPSKYWLVGNENFNVGIGTTIATSKFTVEGDVKVSGVITATSFVGDGSGLTGITATGSGVELRDNGSIVGTASTIDFGDNLTVSPISAGIGTITVVGFVTSGALIGYATEGYVNNLVSISTFSGDYNDLVNTPTGLSSFSNDVGFITSYAEVSTLNDILNRGNTSSIGMSVGVVTATSFIGDGSALTNLPGPQTGIGTFDAIVGVSTIIDSFDIATENISIIEYNIFVNNGQNRIQSQKTLVMLGDEAYSQEYAVMYSTNHLVSVGATISGGICNVTVTPSSGVSGLTTFKFSKGGSV